MGTPLEDFDKMEGASALPFPAPSKQAAGEINGIKTDVTCISFSDKIMITVSQHGRLAQWVTVPLLSDNPTSADPYFHTTLTPEEALLPSTRFAPRTLLGAGTSEREMMGHLFASQIAHAITTKDPSETRSLMLGLGLAKAETEREVFLQVVDLVLSVL